VARDLRVKVRLQADTKDAQRNVNRFRSSFSSLTSTVAKFAIGATAVGFVVGKVVAQFNEWISAANEQEDAIAALDAQLSSLGPASEGVSKALQEQASALQATTRFGDEATIAAQTQLTVFAKSETELKSLTIATQDFATAQRISLVSAAQLLGKTLGSSTNALIRYGIEVDGAAGSTDRAQSIVGAISTLFAGRATAAAETYAGALEQIANAQGDTDEAFGEMITSSETLLNAQQELAREINLFNQELDRSPGFIASVVTGWTNLKILLIDTARVFNGIQEQQFESIDLIRQRAKVEQSLAEFRRLDAREQAAEEKAFQAILDQRLAKEKELSALLIQRDSALSAAGVRTRQELEASLESVEDQLEIITTLGDLGQLSFAQVEEGARKLRIEQEALTAVLDGTATSVDAYKRGLSDTTDKLGDFDAASREAGNGIRDFGDGLESEGARVREFRDTVDGARRSVDELNSAAARGSFGNGNSAGIVSRDRRNQGFVDRAVASGLRPILGGTRIRGAGGGSRLVR